MNLRSLIIYLPQDLLEHFREDIKIEEFKDEICQSLNSYNDKIENLRVSEGYLLLCHSGRHEKVHHSGRLSQ